MDKGGNTICFPMDLQLLALGPPTKKKKKKSSAFFQTSYFTSSD